MQSEQHVIYRLMAGGGAGRPKLTWKKLTEKDCRPWTLTTVDPLERGTWRSGKRSAMHTAGQLPGRGAADVDDDISNQRGKALSLLELTFVIC